MIKNIMRKNHPYKRTVGHISTDVKMDKNLYLKHSGINLNIINKVLKKKSAVLAKAYLPCFLKRRFKRKGDSLKAFEPKLWHIFKKVKKIKKDVDNKIISYALFKNKMRKFLIKKRSLIYPTETLFHLKYIRRTRSPRYIRTGYYKLFKLFFFWFILLYKDLYYYLIKAA